MIRQLGVVIVIFLLGGNISERLDRYAAFGFAILAFAVIRAIVTYFRFYYSVANEELTIERGFLSKSRTTIPFDRIQAVDFDQSPIHRIFDLVKVVINTAGTGGDEVTISALTRAKAEELKQSILQQKSTSELAVEEADILTPETIVKHSLLDLVKIGLASNHFRSFMIIVGFAFWIFQQAEEAQLWERLKALLPEAQVMTSNVTLMVVLFLAVVTASILISIIVTLTRFYGLKLSRIEDRFQLSHGLLNTRQFTAKDQKIQLFTTVQTWLQKQFDYFTISLKQASSQMVRTKKSLLIPGSRRDQIANVVAALFPRESKTYFDGKVSKYYLRYHIRNTIIIGLVVMVPALVTKLYPYLIFGVLIIIFGIVGSLLSYRKLRYQVGENLIKIQGGTFGGKLAVLESYKVQSVSLSANVYQWRRKLNNLRIHTASGTVSIPFVEQKKAREIRDFLLYQIQNTKKPWM